MKMVSWVAVSRMVEREAVANPQYRQKLIGKPLRSVAKDLTDEELLSRLSSFDVLIDHSSLEQLCDQALSAQEISQPLFEQRVFETKLEKQESDWVWICLLELWKRWFPDKPCFELLDDKIQDGYDLLLSSQEKAGCELWLDAWSDVLRIFEKTGMRSVKEFDQRFGGTQLLSDWLPDLEMELWNEGLKERPFLAARISLCEIMLQKFYAGKTGKGFELSTGNWRRALAETYFEVGEISKAETLYREWLQADPQWGFGWISWSDCYSFGQPSAEDLQKSEQVLQEGLSIAGVCDRLDLQERLVDVYKEQGRNDKVKELRQQIEDSTSRHISRHIVREGQSHSINTAADFASTLSPVAQKQTVGRKEPCPCGSGKKFKRCCDQNR
jgi:tetratricopeptide (TPR) repeat protein